MPRRLLISGKLKKRRGYGDTHRVGGEIEINAAARGSWGNWGEKQAVMGRGGFCSGPGRGRSTAGHHGLLTSRPMEGKLQGVSHDLHEAFCETKRGSICCSDPSLTRGRHEHVRQRAGELSLATIACPLGLGEENKREMGVARAVWYVWLGSWCDSLLLCTRAGDMTCQQGACTEFPGPRPTVHREARTNGGLVLPSRSAAERGSELQV